jgi:hypothetical protein
VTGPWVADALAPAQQRADARDELADAERLGQVVVGAALEAVDLVGLFAPRRQHQDRHVLEVRLAPDRAADGDAVEPGRALSRCFLRWHRLSLAASPPPDPR